MEVYPIGIQSGYTISAPVAEQPGVEALPLTSETITISGEEFRSSENSNPTYGRNGKVNTTAAAEEAQESDQGSRTKGKDGQSLSEDETAQVRELKQTDRHVRAHEMAHLAAGSGLVKGGATYSYKQGPDGNLYAVAGEVSIDTSEGSTPRETIARMQRIKAAALAPSDPSPQDRAVAATATAKAAEAASELAMESKQQAKGADEKSDDADAAAGYQGLAAYQKGMKPETTAGQIFQTIF